MEMSTEDKISTSWYMTSSKSFGIMVLEQISEIRGLTTSSTRNESHFTLKMNWYFKLVATQPCAIILTLGALSAIILVISITSTNLPNFSDPQLGFETRGTEIAKRLTAWENLYEAARPSGILTVNPLGNYQPSPRPVAINEDLFLKNKKFHRTRIKSGKVSLMAKDNETEKEKTTTQDWLESQEEGKLGSDSHDQDHDHDHNHLSSDGFFCDGLSPDFSHVVLEAIDPSQSLFSANALISICLIQQKLMNNDMMSSICQTISSGHCCRPWSLSNYIMLLLNRTSCTDLTEEDVEGAKSLLFECAKYYNNLQLRPDCYPNNLCHSIPLQCTRFNAVYNILYYLTDTGFLPTDYNRSDHDVFLNNTMIFLPIARSSAILPFYYNLSADSLLHKNVQVVAMDLGLKNALFNDCLVRDAFLMVAGSAFMFLCIWSYTNSLIITFATVLAITMSLITAYFVYTFLFKIKFFPFMNLLAIVVAIGIGADDAFIFYKMWECFKEEKMNTPVVRLVTDTLRHSSASMFVTSLTTATAFFSSYISSITAINCFSIFAGTAVLANFFLMVTWLPACFVVSQKKWCRAPVLQWRSETARNVIKAARTRSSQIKTVLQRRLELAIFRLRWVWLVLFAFVAATSAVVVLYYPKLRLPDSRSFPLFQASHLFERYDAEYRTKFWFERLEKGSGWDNTNFKLPLRFVWGILPIDNGNFLEPDSKGSLEFDPTFDMAAPESQEWLLNFCQVLRVQPFYQWTLGPLLPNCFIESFENWMQRRCRDVIDDIDRSPCCECSKFPYPRDVFQKCIVKAIASLYETPADYFLPGVAGPKFSKDNEQIKAVVVEYDSNHSYSMSFKDMDQFYTEVETWFQQQLATAPPGMKNGWFISHLGFYDLQLALTDGTVMAIGVSMVVSLAVFFLVSLNVLISVYTIMTISCIIFVTVALLVLMGWSLNVLESIAVSTAIGLAVDFSLHYGISYRLFVENCRESAVGFTLKRMGGPTLMAALTTGAAGVFMLPSSVLAYIQIGVFLIIVMTSSWLYSTVFLMSLLSVAGPLRGFGQFSYKSILPSGRQKKVNSPAESSKTLYMNVLSDSVLSTSTIAEPSLATHLTANETHELEALTRSTKKIQCSSATSKGGGTARKFSP